MPTVLSTKILNSRQKRHLFAANIGLVEYNAVEIKPLYPDLPTHTFKNVIFTSQNAVRLAMAKDIKIDKVFCVGDKTAKYIESFGLNIQLKAYYARDLALQIIKKYPYEHFDFFCSAQRRDDLPFALSKHQVSLKEYHLYDSVCSFKTFTNRFDAVLCFSPLGVKSYYTIHDKKPMAICIGKTTAKAAELYTKAVYVASKTSIDSVVIKAIKTFN
ncbi:uroporphyrinogen-III synthase [Flavobacteriaceae bacterium 14752]|uniref:uroporphyrinogen-III synthase n=1 Tax=Mesohalobacter salilacus TaxID=2491711 RepID=UPI000F637941|nr:uroporphyrinogen-III synthase [Flavobacteriaceae bacterium 14752]